MRKILPQVRACDALGGIVPAGRPELQHSLGVF